MEMDRVVGLEVCHPVLNLRRLNMMDNTHAPDGATQGAESYIFDVVDEIDQVATKMRILTALSANDLETEDIQALSLIAYDWIRELEAISERAQVTLQTLNDHPLEWLLRDMTRGHVTMTELRDAVRSAFPTMNPCVPPVMKNAA